MDRCELIDLEERSRRRAGITVLVSACLLTLPGAATEIGELRVSERAAAWRLFGYSVVVGLVMAAVAIAWMWRSPRALEPMRSTPPWSVATFAAVTGGIGLLLNDLVPGGVLPLVYGWALGLLPILFVAIYLMQARRRSSAGEEAYKRR